MAVVARLARELGGLSIDCTRTEFVTARLARQVDRLGMADFGAYLALVESDAASGERARFIEALTTHTTSFYRETAQYDWLRETGLAEIVAQGAGGWRDLVIWSAACSSGQELYSAMMTAMTFDPAAGRQIQVRGYGTDISGPILDQARRAIYTRDEIAGIPADMRRKFLLSSRGAPVVYRIVPDLRDRTQWIQGNLADDHSLPRIRADVAMLRNVLIYFDAETRDQVLRNVVRRLHPGGYLLTGHSEAIRPEDYGLTSVRPSIYRSPA